MYCGLPQPDGVGVEIVVVVVVVVVVFVVVELAVIVGLFVGFSFPSQTTLQVKPSILAAAFLALLAALKTILSVSFPENLRLAMREAISRLESE